MNVKEHIKIMIKKTCHDTFNVMRYKYLHQVTLRFKSKYGCFKHIIESEMVA